jgi:hypothetical protein
MSCDGFFPQDTKNLEVFWSQTELVLLTVQEKKKLVTKRNWVNKGLRWRAGEVAQVAEHLGVKPWDQTPEHQKINK